MSATIDAFGDDWSLPVDDLRLWVCLQEIASHAVLGVPHVRAELESLLTSYVAGFEPDPDALGDKLGRPRPDRRRRPGRPAARCSATPRSCSAPSSRRPSARCCPASTPSSPSSSATSTTSWTPSARGLRRPLRRVIAEAVRRRRVEADQSDIFVERLLGLKLTQAAVRAGPGLRRRRGRAGTATWRGCGSRPASCPRRPRSTPPGLWLARIEFD